MARILVPLDESPLAEESLGWAAAFARAHDFAIHLLAVRTSEDAFWEFADVRPSGPVQEAADSLPSYLAAVATRPPLAGRPVTTEVRSGDVVEQILDSARRGETSFVVITTRGEGGFGRDGTGSVADSLVRTLPMPVLVVPPQSIPPGIGAILVPLDGSNTSKAALAPARQLARATGATIHLLRVIEPIAGLGADDEETETALDAATEGVRLGLHEIAEPGEVQVVLHGEPVDLILEYAHGNRCQIIAMATHGWSGPVREEIGSTTDRVVSSSPRPVLVVRAASEH